MKKIWILAITILLLMNTNLVFADRATTYTDTRDERIVLTFNVPKLIEGQDCYIPIFAQMIGMAMTADGGWRRVFVADELGEVTITKKTKSEIKVLLEKDELKALYTAFYLDALDEVVN